jgi:hypothetical protein
MAARLSLKKPGVAQHVGSLLSGGGSHVLMPKFLNYALSSTIQKLRFSPRFESGDYPSRHGRKMTKHSLELITETSPSFQQPTARQE